MRDAVQEIAGAIQRIDDEARLAVLTRNIAALFHQEAIAGADCTQFIPQDSLRCLIGLGHEIGRAFAADLQMLDFAKVAAQAAARFACGFFHHADKARKCCHGVVQPTLLT